jgi:SsrA-binding protein
MSGRAEDNIISSNRKAFHEYTIMDKYEAGIALVGTEVKSARAGKVNLSDGWVHIDANDEAFLMDAHISKYTHGNLMNHEETRPRKLLMNRKEIIKLTQKIEEKGLTVVPLKMYFKDSWIKLEIGVAKGKKAHDKRDAAKEREANRSIQRTMRRG